MMHYYQHNINDYLADTHHLSLLEHGVYSRLIQHYYAKESGFAEHDLTTVERKLRICSIEEKEAFKNVLADFFILQNGVYTHLRCEKEIALFKDKQEKASAAGKASVEARRTKNKGIKPKKQTKLQQVNNDDSTDIEQTLSECSTDVEPTNNHKPITINQEPLTNNLKPTHTTREEKTENQILSEVADATAEPLSLENTLKLWNPPLKEVNAWLQQSGLKPMTQQDFENLKPAFLGHYAPQIQIGTLPTSKLFVKLVSWVKRDFEKPKPKSTTAAKPKTNLNVNAAWDALPKNDQHLPVDYVLEPLPEGFF